MTDRKIERGDGRCFGRQRFLANSIEKKILHEKKSDSSQAEIYKQLKPFWLLNWVRYRKSGNTFSSSELLAVSRTAADWETPCVCARPSNPPKLSQSSAPTARLLIKLDFAFKTSIVFWNSLWEQSPDDRQRLELGLKLELCHLTNGL